MEHTGTSGSRAQDTAVINLVWRDKDGNLWHQPQVYLDFTFKKKPLAPPCVSYCSWNLSRWHLTCLRCGLRRTKGDPKPRRVNEHLHRIPVDLPRWRLILIKLLHSLAEALSE